MQRASRHDLVRALAPRYGHVRKSEKTEILDQVCEVTGYTRKHALALLKEPPEERAVSSAHGGAHQAMAQPRLSCCGALGRSEVPSIVRAAELMVDAISRDRAVYVYGSGHSVIPLVDIFPRYGSFAGFRPLLDRA